ncbi:hypothetical protein [Mesorhizobium sp. B1-1-8]|uniref:hypothetical protein n=1 Tax=Mesorhizobium sp. B1-1-8 TaxID=2589976 RepID=UPI001D035CC9|nr:hypothetical protein [Mesorhizobium sp. B1-1-8]UCI05081.1 hypothetical protein FJ974_14490 [Mesorhizobium sp. B1-1-8]
MPNHLAGIYTNDTDLAILGGMVILALAGVFLMVRHALIAVQRRRLKPNAYLKECRPVPVEEVPWVWERPVDLATGPASSQAAVPSDADARPQDANYRQFGVRIEHFDILSEASESSPGDQLDAFASPANIATASPPRGRGAIRLVSRLGVAAICLAVPLGYAMTRQNWVESAPAVSQAQDHPDLSRSFEAPASAALDMRGPAQGDGRTNVGLLGPDLATPKAQVEAARAQASAARELADQERRAVEEERARSASLQSALFESRKQVDALRTSMAAADSAYGERLRNELAAARTLDALRRIAGDARTLLAESINYAFTQMPAAHRERQRTELMARDLSQARAQISQLEATAAEDRAKARASLAQASGMLDDERRKSKALRADLAAMEQSKAAIADTAERERTGAARVEQTAAETAQALARERASAVSTHEGLDKARLERDAAEQERARAVSARERAEQTAAETAQALAQARASEVSTHDDLDKARAERDAAEQERARAVSAKERAEQTATETAHALAQARASAASTHDDLDKARLERGTSRALLGQVTRLNEALDRQREATVSLARVLAAARADNDKLRAERRSAQIEPPLKPSSGRASAGTGQVKAVSQKTTMRSKVRNSSRAIRVRSITLPFPLRPRQPTLD